VPVLALTALLVACTVPHAIEDFRYGEFAQHHVPVATARTPRTYSGRCSNATMSACSSTRAGFPTSRHSPQFNRDALEASMPDDGIA